MAGVDVVHHQIVPGFTGKIHQWIAGDSDGEFFHFGLAKLASSAAVSYTHLDYRTNELVRLAGDDVADANTYSQGTAIQQYGEDGVVLNLADYQDYIKYYWDYVDGHPNGRNVAINADGSMYYFMDAMNNEDNIMGAQSFTAFAYRFDVLQKLGLTPATTLDEFTQLCADVQAKIEDVYKRQI